MWYLCCKNKGADQLCSYCTLADLSLCFCIRKIWSDLRLCFRICKIWFSGIAAHFKALLCDIIFNEFSFGLLD